MKNLPSRVHFNKNFHGQNRMYSFSPDNYFSGNTRIPKGIKPKAEDPIEGVRIHLLDRKSFLRHSLIVSVIKSGTARVHCTAFTITMDKIYHLKI